MRPDIVNNSWGGGPGDGFYLEVVQAWRAAGIIPVFSAGNAGPECDSGGSPGDFLEAFSVGATDENDQIADFSSRGPSTYGKVIPDVSAPGVDVVSSVPGDGYDSFSGTSMAAPHTAGTLALVLSAELALLGNVDGSTDAVRSTALDIADDSCGGDEDGDPNNVFGDGRIDAQAAVALVATGGTLAGDVTDVVSSDPIAGARIEATTGGRTFATTSDAAGHFELFLGAGTYTVTASAFGYQSALVTGVEIETDLTTTQDFFLAPLPQRDITGTVTAEEDGSPIEGAEVRAIGTPVAAGDDGRERQLHPDPAHRRLHDPDRGGRVHEQRGVRGHARARRPDARRLPGEASSMTSVTAVARSRSTGSTPRRTRRCSATRPSGGSLCRSRSRSTARATTPSTSRTTAT